MPRDLPRRQMRILFVASSSGECHGLRLELAADVAYVLEMAEDGAGAFVLASHTSARFDAVLVNIDLADGDGASVCARMRRDGFQGPIILIAETAGDSTIVHGLNSGANDFVHAPFRVGEVKARLRAQIRVSRAADKSVLSIGSFLFRPAERVLQHSITNEQVKLTEKEAALLKFLYLAKTPSSRIVLLDTVWGYNGKATTHTVETHIYKLRCKLATDPKKNAVIVNEGLGYQLCVEKPFPSLTGSHPAGKVTAAIA